MTPPSTSQSHSPFGPGLLVAFALAFVLHACVLATAWSDPERFMDRPDSTEYVTLASSLLDGHGFTQSVHEPYEPDLRRTPVYPTVLASAFAVSGRSPRVAAVLGATLALVTLLVVAAVAAPDGRSAVWVSALIVATDLTSLGYQHLALTEALFALLVLAALFVLLRRSDAVPIGLATGALLGLATLCRPIGVLLAPALLPYFVRRSRRGVNGAMREYLVTNIAAGVTIGAWVLRNYVTAGAITLTAVGGVNMYLHRAAYVQAALTNRPVEEVRADLERTFEAETSGLSDGDKVRWLESHGTTVVGAHPLAYVQASLNGLVRMIGSDVEPLQRQVGVSSTSRAGQAIEVAGWLQLSACYLLAAWGALRAWRTPDARERLVLLLITLVYFSVIGGPEMYARFRTPLMPLVALLGGFAVAAGNPSNV